MRQKLQYSDNQLSFSRWVCYFMTSQMFNPIFSERYSIRFKSSMEFHQRNRNCNASAINSRFPSASVTLWQLHCPSLKRHSNKVFTRFSKKLIFCKTKQFNTNKNLVSHKLRMSQLDRVPVSVSEWLLWSFVLILRRVPWPLPRWCRKSRGHLNWLRTDQIMR